MIDINKLESVNAKYIDNIKRMILTSKDSVKRYKLEQAEKMKQMMISDSPSNDMNNFFQKFQMELKEKEANEGTGRLKELISREIDMMKMEILNSIDENSSPSSFGFQQSSAISPSQINNINETYPTSSFGSQSSDNGVENILKELNSNSSGLDLNASALDKELNSPLNNISDDTKVPVETKELDKWISEIKNLI